MAFINVEIKARTTKAEAIRAWLVANHADFKGTDIQTDTYFAVREGRLKLREGNIENNLIYYRRPNQAGPKQSDFSLLAVPDPTTLKEMLQAAVGILTVVEKKREIYFLSNVKIHLDILDTLGSFVEIEASNKYAPLSTAQLKEQCDFYVRAFEIEDHDLVDVSYSDMVLAAINTNPELSTQ